MNTSTILGTMIKLLLLALSTAAGNVVEFSHHSKINDADICDKLKNYDQQLDHFDYTSQATFTQRYIFEDPWKCGKKCNGILLYTGNEASIEGFCRNERFMEIMARKYYFKILFIEHRYYGGSHPAKQHKIPSDLKNQYQYLTVEQQLLDFVTISSHLNEFSLPVIAFGGSYGGMLSAWLRLKYPHVVKGAIAGSAPVDYSEQYDKFRCEKYFEITTATFSTPPYETCSSSIRAGFDYLQTVTNEQAGSDLGFCGPTNPDFPAELVDNFVVLAMANYPIKNSFLIENLPAWPVQELCRKIETADGAIGTFREVAQFIYNSTGNVKDCLPVGGESRQQGMRWNRYSAAGPIDFDMDSWVYQTCTQMPMPMCYSDGDMFPKLENPSVEERDRWCFERYGVHIDKNWIKNQMGFFRNSNHTFSNIIFTNGRYDPWRAGTVPESAQNLENDVLLINIEDGAHHSELFAPSPSDPDSIQHARGLIEAYVLKWALSN